MTRARVCFLLGKPDSEQRRQTLRFSHKIDDRSNWTMVLAIRLFLTLGNGSRAVFAGDHTMNT